MHAFLSVHLVDSSTKVKTSGVGFIFIKVVVAMMDLACNYGFKNVTFLQG